MPICLSTLAVLQFSRYSKNSTTLRFTYGVNGLPMAVNYNGTYYYYVTNALGDVTALLNSSGTAVVTYVYDAWGNIISTGGTMASTLGTYNPFRYRSYVYDQETELYYLQSRYYNPEIGRFINADKYASTGQGILGYNMFAYCQNNPVVYADYTGHFVFTVIGTIIGATFGAIDAAIQGKSGNEFWGMVASSAISGAASGIATDILVLTGGTAGVVVGAMATAGVFGSVLGNFAENAINCVPLEEYDWGAIATDAAWDATFGALFGYMSGPMNSSWNQVVKKGFGKFIRRQFQKEFASGVAEESLSNVTSGFGRFTLEIIAEMVLSVFQ